jgi:hypothetical protein
MRCCIIPIAAHRPTRLRRTGTIPSTASIFLTQRHDQWDLFARRLRAVGRRISRTRRTGAVTIIRRCWQPHHMVKPWRRERDWVQTFSVRRENRQVVADASSAR